MSNFATSSQKRAWLLSPADLQERRANLNRDYIQGHPCQRLNLDVAASGAPSAVLDADFDTHMPGVNSPVAMKREPMVKKEDAIMVRTVY